MIIFEKLNFSNFFKFFLTFKKLKPNSKINQFYYWIKNPKLLKIPFIIHFHPQNQTTSQQNPNSIRINTQFPLIFPPNSHLQILNFNNHPHNHQKISKLFFLHNFQSVDSTLQLFPHKQLLCNFASSKTQHCKQK